MIGVIQTLFCKGEGVNVNHDIYTEQQVRGKPAQTTKLPKTNVDNCTFPKNVIIGFG